MAAPLGRQLNATDLFIQPLLGEEIGLQLQPSESFWTSIFALFLLHLGSQPRQNSTLPVYQCRLTSAAPWYERRSAAPELIMEGLKFDGIVVEPRTLKGFSGAPETISGIRPDLFFTIKMETDKRKYCFVENKTVGNLNSNQLQAYPKFINYLSGQNYDCEYLLLLSVGCSNKTFREAQGLQARLQGHFGLLLWEEVFRQMKIRDFDLPFIREMDLLSYAKCLETEVC